VLFLPQNALLIFFVTIIALLISSVLAVRKITLVRRIRLTVAFLLFLIIIGGLVYFAYLKLDGILPDTEDAAPENRRLLITALLLLLGAGLIKLVLSLFSSTKSERAAMLTIDFLGKNITLEAFVDTGNLLKDPMDRVPVMLIKRSVAEGLFPEGIPRLQAHKINEKYQKHLRLVPMKVGDKTVILIAFKPDTVRFNGKKGDVEIKITVAIDEGEGSFGGYRALLPSAALEGI